MPLSDREQQILQEIEKSLYEQDPDFAHGVAASTLQKHLVRNTRRGALLFAAGLTLLIAFLFYPSLVLGVLAFLCMLAGATFTYHNLRKIGREQLRILREQNLFSNLVGRLGQRFRPSDDDEQG